MTTIPSCGEEERIDSLVDHLRERHAVDPAAIRVVRAPLRISPLGAHIDHQLGVVAGMAIDRSVLLAFAPTDGGLVHVDSLNFEKSVAFNLAHIPLPQTGDWGSYLRGAALALQGAYQITQGLVGAIECGMPIGGLSSSAAVTIAYLLSLETVNELLVSPRANVGLVHATEHQYIGLNNGILDQSVILFSRAHELTRIDCQSAVIDHVPTAMPPNAFDILVVYSGVTRTLVGTGYNDRVAECQKAAHLLLAYDGQDAGCDPRLRHVAPALFAAYGHRLPNPLRRRATHYFGEMRRVRTGIAAWQSGDLVTLGSLISESGNSSIHFYESGSPQLISLYEILCHAPGVYGTRFSGAGFRGSCIALIDPDARATIVEVVKRLYPAAHPEEADRYSMHFCRPEACAQLLDRTF